MFHAKAGSLIVFDVQYRHATRRNANQEFNNGLVFSRMPLTDGELFEVKIEKKLECWSGSIEIGVTTRSPELIDIPSSTNELRAQSWILTGTSILKDGRSVTDGYGCDTDKLNIGDRVGVQRNSTGELRFFANGVDCGIAAVGIPPLVFAVVDLYGKCAEISLMESMSVESNSRQMTLSTSDEVTVQQLITNDVIGEYGPTFEQVVSGNDSLRFHTRCGLLVCLSEQNRTAERCNFLDEFNNGVVMTQRPLKDGELFELRLDKLVDKWSGSIEVGITTYNPDTLKFPSTMTNLRSGTIMMSGCGILINGKGTKREYGGHNLDELTEGDTIGLVRKTNSCLHYYVNRVDQGVAATNVPATVYGVADLYGMTVKVTLVDRDLSEDDLNNCVVDASPDYLNFNRPDEQLVQMDSDVPLLFSDKCGSQVSVSADRRTAQRINVMDDFNNAVVMTSRPLMDDELFEIRLDKVVSKWSGSIEIGVTTHNPCELDFPSTMTNIRSGTWMLTGNGLMHNGTNIKDDYGQHLDRLAIGERVGVMRRKSGHLHFFVNGRDQGMAASDVCQSVYGVVDLYGQAAQATIVDRSESAMVKKNCMKNLNEQCGRGTELLFDRVVHGSNVRVSEDGLIVGRMCPDQMDNMAVFARSSRRLRDGEVFEFVLDRMAVRGASAIELGIAAIRSDDLTCDSLQGQLWLLSGSDIIHDGVAISTEYQLNLDCLGVCDRVGVSRHFDSSLHFYLNGQDQGPACENIPKSVFVLVHLSGQCSQIRLCSSIFDKDSSVMETGCRPDITRRASSGVPQKSTEDAGQTVFPYRFSGVCGKNVLLRSSCSTATRVRDYNHAILCSDRSLQANIPFVVKIDELASQWSGSLRIGVTSTNVTQTKMTDESELTLSVNGSGLVTSRTLPSQSSELPGSTWVWLGTEIKRNEVTVRSNYGPALGRLKLGDTVGVMVTQDRSLVFLLNEQNMGVAATNLPPNVYAVVDLYGTAQTICIVGQREGAACGSECPDVTKEVEDNQPSVHQAIHLNGEVDSNVIEVVSPNTQTAVYSLSESTAVRFSLKTGKNIVLSESCTVARRAASYNQAIVISHKPLDTGQLFELRVNSLEGKWTSSLMVGIVSISTGLDRVSLPVTALAFRKPSWIVAGNSIYQNTIKVGERRDFNLDDVGVGQTVGVLIDKQRSLHLYLDGCDKGVVAKNVSCKCHAVVDLYGQCTQVSIGSSLNSINTEKANLEIGVKEKIDKDKRDYRKGTIAEPSRVSCDYQALCKRFTNTLCLPECYFSGAVLCYCESCYQSTGVRGVEPNEQINQDTESTALGWCCFSLSASVEADKNADARWCHAYSLVKPGQVRQTLDLAQLISAADMERLWWTNDMAVNASDKTKLNSEDADQTSSPVVLAPDLSFLDSQHYDCYSDSKSGFVYECRLCFKVLVKSDSCSTVNVQVQNQTSKTPINWLTKERGATKLVSLCVKIDKPI